MKKKYIAALTTLILLFALTSYVIGYLLQKHYQEALQLFSQNSKINLKLTHYKRSLFHSDAIIAASFPLIDKPMDMQHIDKENVLIIKQHIYHGPILFYRKSMQVGVKFALAYIDSFFDNNHHFGETTIAFNHNLTAHFNLDEYKILHGESVKYLLNGLFGDAYFDAAKNLFTANLTLRRLLSNIDTHREIANFKLKTTLRKNVWGFWTGDKHFHFGLLKWQQGDKEFIFEKFDYALNNQMINNHLTSKLQVNIDSALMNAINYGPQTISVVMTNLNVLAFKTLEKYFSSQTENVQILNLSHDFMMLFNEGTKFRINNLMLNTAYGKVALTGNISYSVDNQVKNRDVLLSKINTKIQGQLPVALANSLLTHYYLLQLDRLDLDLAKTTAEESLKKWQEMGWLQKSADNFLINLSFPRRREPMHRLSLY